MIRDHEKEISVVRIECGDRGLNSYVVTDSETGRGVIIDAPDDAKRILVEARPFKIEAILITHTHADQLFGLHTLRSETGAPVWVNALDAMVFNYFTPVNSERPEYTFEDSINIIAGGIELTAIHTPGHTPGATCYLVGKHLFTGESLLSNGPGVTNSPQDHEQSMTSILEKIFNLSDDLTVHPGFGDDFPIMKTKTDFEGFPTGLYPSAIHGDVMWRTNVE